MHVIERTDAFTIVGADARRGKLTLFARRGPARAGPARAHRAARRRPRGGARAAARDLPSRARDGGSRASRPRGARPRPGRGRDGRRLRPRPRRAARAATPSRRAPALAELGFEPRGRPARARRPHVRAESGGAPRGRAPAAQPPRPCASSRREQHIDEARERGLEIADIVDAANTLAVFVWGPDRIKLEYVEHKAELLARLSRSCARPDRRRRRDGRASRAAARGARARRATCCVLEKGDRPGGSMLLSSGVVWRYRELRRAFAPSARAATRSSSALVHDRLDDALSWLESLGAPVLERETGNPLTTGRSLRHRGLTAALVPRGRRRVCAPRAARERSRRTSRWCSRPAASRATASWCASTSRREADELLLRANRGAPATGCGSGSRRVARSATGMDEFYGRNMPAPPARLGEQDFVPLAQLYARTRPSRTRAASATRPRTWSEIDVVQWTARQPRARAWYRCATRRSASGCASAPSAR